jgi:hypothetical protein
VRDKVFSPFAASIFVGTRTVFQKVAPLRLNCGVDGPMTDVVVSKIVEIAKTVNTTPTVFLSECWVRLASLGTSPPERGAPLTGTSE